MIDFEREEQKDEARQNERNGEIRLVEVKRTRYSCRKIYIEVKGKEV